VPWSLEGSWGTPRTRGLFGANGDLIWNHKSLPGYPRASADLSLVCVLCPGGILTIINDDGEPATITYSDWRTPFLVSGNGDKIIINDLENGTVVLDGQGGIIKHLKKGYCGWVPYLIGGSPDVGSYYASSDYIIQLCRKAEVRDHRVQVYNGSARLLWEKEFPWQEHHGLRFGISPNEKYLLLCVRLPDPKCILYRVKNGKRLGEIYFEEGDFDRFVECGITNDGRRCFVTTLDNTNLKSKTFIFEEGEKIAEYDAEAPEDYTCCYPLAEFSRDGSYLALSFGKGFTIYRIDHD
jgi:hypothetical protein